MTRHDVCFPSYFITFKKIIFQDTKYGNQFLLSTSKVHTTICVGIFLIGILERNERWHLKPSKSALY